MRRFLVNTFLVSLPVLLLLGGLWAYYSWYVVPHLTRDLSRLALLPFPVEYTVAGSDTVRYEYLSVDSIPTDAADGAFWVLGDSFTHGRGPEGYLAYFYPDSTRNIVIECFDPANGVIVNPVQMFVALCNSDIAMPRTVVVEMAQRNLASMIGWLDFGQVYAPKTNGSKLEDKNVTRRSTYGLLQAVEYAQLRLGLLFSPVKRARLSTPMFTCPGRQSDLYFYSDDLKIPDDDAMRRVADNMRRVSEIAHRRGVDLYLFIAANKYEIYRPYITDNPYPESDTLDSLVSAIGNDRVINSADTLRQMAADGVLDIYHCDDTHWSAVGAKAAGEYLKDRLH